ncbi:conjugal transfer protein [Actinopolymorpha sp. NPDC004070]|uniref:conjugal transfer protein n=1 Tax=Actinopolymorpha sp. NPDC004070 TaxID=3154548 RepID=UPI0033BA350C
MTEPNEPTTPLARMRFSWQRGTDVSDAPEVADDEASVDDESVHEDAVEPDVDERDADERDAGSLRAGGTPASPSRPEPGPADRPAQGFRPDPESRSARGAQPGSDLPTTPAPPRAAPSTSSTSTNGHAVTDDSPPTAPSRRVSEEARNRLDESRSASPSESRSASRSESQPEPDVDDPAWVATDLGELDDDAAAESESRRRRKRRERQERKSRAAQAKAAQKNARRTTARKAAAKSEVAPVQVGDDQAAADQAAKPTSRTPVARTNVAATSGRLGGTTTGTTRATDRPRARPVAPAPAVTATKRSRRDRGDFDVPAPGRRFSGGRAAHTGLRVALVVTACLLALGVVGYAAFALGISTGRDNSPRLSSADLARYRLTAFPTAEAGQFAADYARLCFTHDPTPGANDARERQLARYVSGGTDPRCGWNGEGSQSVADATWTGDSEPIDVPGLQGNARMMTVRVLTDSGSSRIVTVPVYVADLANANGMRIVGDIGEMPQPNLAAAPEVKPPAATDSRLSEALTQGQFFEQFFTAWGASDRPALQRLVTPDATARTTAGLNRVLASPTIQEARVFLPKGADPSTPYEWKTRQTTQAWVWVVWRTPGEGSKATETRAYRLQLVKTTQASSPTQEWAVRDIQGGIPDVKGG